MLDDRLGTAVDLDEFVGEFFLEKEIAVHAGEDDVVAELEKVIWVGENNKHDAVCKTAGHATDEVGNGKDDGGVDANETVCSDSAKDVG